MDIYGVIGWPIKHSLSPAMHNAAFKELGIDAEYRKFEVKSEELEDFLLKDILVKDSNGNSVRAKEIKGFNVTIPHKIRAKEILEKNFPLDKNKSEFEELYYIEVSGAVNTVKRSGSGLEYCNTDVEGFLKAVTSKEELGFDLDKESNVLLLGCGGAGRAVVAGLSLDFEDSNIKKIYIYDKSKEAVNSAKDHFSKLHKKWMNNLKNATEFISEGQMPDKIKECQLLVNASPVGMKEDNDSSVIEKELLHRDLYVYDLVYNRETRLVRDAEDKLGKSRVKDGRGMLVHQGAFSFSLWTGVPAAKVVDVMREALNKVIR